LRAFHARNLPAQTGKCNPKFGLQLFFAIYFFKGQMPFETIFDGFYHIKCGKKKVNYKK